MASNSVETVNADPTKAFFVTMLTRDIELVDAILDLLDNCVDGILRQQKGKSRINKKQPYKGYWAKITANSDGFTIEDNCGGISKEIAVNSAFMLGRPDPERDASLETVGMYGIGMKRAIFKMGKSCTVTSKPVGEDAYKVTISPKWLEQDDNWKLPLESTRKLQNDGTKIEVRNLHPSIKKQFKSSSSAFIDHLINEVSKLFAIIIEKGFTVKINRTTVKPVDLLLMTPKKVGATRSKVPKIEPYVFVGEYYGVQINLVVGFYRPLATETEVDDELTRRRTRNNAGWTIVCNDRVVLHNDTSMKTGWGTASVPSYHNQFIAISGVVFFRSNDSMNLPLNTTKRGLDTSSEVYLIVLDQMREGMKKFISFTNTWKKREEETASQFLELEPAKPVEIAKRVADANFSKSRKHNSKGSGKFYSPELPKPDPKSPTRRISFTADQKDIELVGEYYFDDSSTNRNEVGQRCFEECLHEAREEIG